MEATLKFKLPDDKADFVLASNVWKFYTALSEITQQLRSYNKYGHEFKDTEEAIEKIYEMVLSESGDLLDLVN